MPRYFFHTEDGRPFHDADGPVLRNDTAARVLGQLVNERPEEIWRDDTVRITVTDDRGAMLFLLDLSALEATASGAWRPSSGAPGTA